MRSHRPVRHLAPIVEEVVVGPDAPLPQPPPSAAMVIARTGVSTVRQALALREEDILRLPSVGPHRARLFLDWQERLRDVFPEIAAWALPEPPPTGGDWREIMLGYPPIFDDLVLRLGLHVPLAVLVLDPTRLVRMGLLAEGDVPAFEDWQSRLQATVEAGGPPTAEAPAASLRSILDTLLLALPENERQRVLRYYAWGWSPEEIARQDGIPAQQVRRELPGLVRALHTRFGPTARDGLRREWALGLLGPGLLHSRLGADSTVSLSEAWLLAEIATGRRWLLAEGGWLSQGSKADLKLRLERLRAAAWSTPPPRTSTRGLEALATIPEDGCRWVREQRLLRPAVRSGKG